jgi:hypothetical protein
VRTPQPFAALLAIWLSLVPVVVAAKPSRSVPADLSAANARVVFDYLRSAAYGDAYLIKFVQRQPYSNTMRDVEWGKRDIPTLLTQAGRSGRASFLSPATRENITLAVNVAGNAVLLNRGCKCGLLLYIAAIANRAPPRFLPRAEFALPSINGIRLGTKRPAVRRYFGTTGPGLGKEEDAYRFVRSGAPHFTDCFTFYHFRYDARGAVVAMLVSSGC